MCSVILFIILLFTNYIHTYVCTYMHAYIHTYIHTYIRTYIHTYIHTCISLCVYVLARDTNYCLVSVVCSFHLFYYIGSRGQYIYYVSVQLKSFFDEDICEWLQKCKGCCSANHETKIQKLPTILEGEALAGWLKLSNEHLTTISQIVLNEFISLEALIIFILAQDSKEKLLHLISMILSNSYNKLYQDWQKCK